MKKTILLSVLTIVTGSVIYLNKPINANGVDNITPKQKATPVAVNTTTYSTSITVECPVVGTVKPPVIMEPEYEYTVTGAETYYSHCKSCNTGVFLAPKEGEAIKCTYCGILKNSVDNNQ